MEARALGKGLSALIPERTEGAQLSTVTKVAVDKIRGNALQPRSHYEQAKLNELKTSIQAKGILQPILVRETEPGSYEVIAGERRLRAAQELGLSEVPVVIKKAGDDESLLLALVENIQREDLNAIEEARAYVRLAEDFQLSLVAIARAVGKSESAIQNTIRLLKLPAEIQQAVVDGKISMGHARALITVADPQRQKAIFQDILDKGLSVREVENRVRCENPVETRGKRKAAQRHHEVVFLEEDLQQALGTKVRIIPFKRRGKIEIEYYSPDDLERIIRVIKGASA